MSRTDPSPPTPSATYHPIEFSEISRGATEVLDRLNNAGYASQLVGGCVRDLYLGHSPKDFDVATAAHPEQVREVFRRARLIGRRFKLVHVRAGREIIEVSTYRSSPGAVAHEDRTEHGRLLRDNVYGVQDDDVWRRDFTINALYYDHRKRHIVDYVGGVADLDAGVVRMIGNAKERCREDPVRALRAIRFAAALGFAIDRELAASIEEAGPLVGDVPAARLFDEVLKLFHRGYASATYELLRDYGLFSHLFPLSAMHLQRAPTAGHEKLYRLALRNTDQRVSDGKPVIAAFLMAVFLWGPVRAAVAGHREAGVPDHESEYIAADEVLAQQSVRTTVPRRVATPIKEIWAMQPRLVSRRGRAARLLENRRFRAAYDFLVLRSEAGDADSEAADWWTRFQEVDESQRHSMVRDRPTHSAKDRPRRRRRRSAGA